ncbi:MAG: Gfo/Idh/MocA family oxidoreductase [Rubellimicrobium sp.]|nr:Gfo/Idh/MocA family oxidoreductase [Rubellimicrobium sp.]
MEPVGIGIIGTGNISDAYLKAAPGFPVLRMVACADINMEAARAKAATYGIEAMEVAALLADPRIEVVLNLTTPQHHVPVGLQVIAAGKHVYAEKPLAVELSEAVKLVAAAEAAGLRVGSAPDTFLGGSHQTARAALDDGIIGEVVAGSAHMMVPGHELWHPNPDFYYKAGGGPMLDMGPYYLTCLVNMIGPVSVVTGAVSRAHETRTIASGPRAGEVVSVEVPTHISGILDFANGAQVTITTSFDVWKHGHNHIELYGRTGAMIVPDPNRFDGAVMVADGKGEWRELPQAHGYGDDNYRILGLADMATAIRAGRPHRAGLELALHVLEIMEAIIRSGEAGQRLELGHPAARPAAMIAGLPKGVLDPA